MVTPDRLILPEIARRYGRPLATVRTAWAADPAWPAPCGKRGRYNEYDAAAVDAAVQSITGRPQLDGDGAELLTFDQIAEATGLAAATIRSDLSRGRWPAPDDTGDGVKRWRRSTVRSVMETRRAYRRG